MRTERLQRLLELVRTRAYREGEFVLRSGETSHFYLDGKQVTMTPEGAYLLASEILERLKPANVKAIAGPTLGADPIVGAVCALSHSTHQALAALIIRKGAKDHGTGKLIEGPELPGGSRVAVVEDVITRGGEVKRSIAVLEEKGYHVATVICLVDRQAGGGEELRRMGYNFDPLFTLEQVSAHSDLPGSSA